MTLKTEIAQLPTVATVAPTDWLVIQPGVGGTPLRKATAEQVMNGLIDAIGTGTIVADDVIITGGTATLEVGNITDLTAGTIAISGGTGTLSTADIQTLTVLGTATVGLGAFTTLNAGTVDIDNGDALLQTATIDNLNAGTIIATAVTLTTLSSLADLTVTGTATIGHVAGTTGTITTGTIGTLTANAGTVTLGKATITDLASTTLSASGTATIGTAVVTAGTVTTLTGTKATIGEQTLQDASGVTPFGWAVRNEDGDVILGYDNDTLFMNNVRLKGDITVMGDVVTPNAETASGVPEYAYSVASSGAVGDGTEAWLYMTWSSAATTFTAYRYRGSCTIGAGSTTLTIVIAENDGVAFQRGIDEGRSIAIAGAGTAGADHVSTIVSVLDGSTVTIADAAVTALSASTQNVIWPAFSSAQVDTSIWIDQSRLRSYWVGAVTSVDTTDVYPQRAFMAIVDQYVSPFSLTLDRALTGAATALVKHVVIGTDNAQAVSDAGTAMAAAGKSVLWFPGNGLYCIFRRLSGTSDDPSYTNFTAIDATLGEANEQQSSERDAVWLTGSARFFGVDTGGRQMYNRIVPVDAPSPYLPTAGVRGAKHMPAWAAEDTPIFMNLGDSIGTYDPSKQNQAQTEATLLENALMMSNPDKSITILHRSMGGGTWGELACDTNTRGANVDDVYPWFTNTGVSWLSYATTASPVPDTFGIPQHVINDNTGFHPIHMFSVINRLRALTTRMSNSPDVILHTSPHVIYSFGVPGQNQGLEMMELYAGYARGVSAKYGYGLIDIEGRALATQWGFDPGRRWLRRIPLWSHALAPTTPAVIPTRCRAWRGRLQFTGASGSAVWTAIGTLRIGLSARPDNYMEITTNGSGYLTTFVQSWGRSVSSTVSITNGATTLVSNGQTAITDDLAWVIRRTACVIGTEGSGPLTSAYDGKCLLWPGTDYGTQPQRTFIEKVIGDAVARVDDTGPIVQSNYSGNATVYIGGMMFVSHDAHAKSDIIITDGSGNIHKTKITGFTDRNTVTLQDAWPYTTLSSATATIWVGHIAEDTATSTIDAYNDAGADPVLEFSALGNHVLVRYIVGSILDEGAGRPAEPPILFNKVTIRGGGPFLPKVECTGAGLTVEMGNMWVDDDMLFKPGGTRRLLRGAADTTASSQWGGQSSHAAGPWGELVYRPVYDAQNFAA